MHLILLSGTVKNLSDSQWVMEPVFFILTVWILKFLYVFYDLWDLLAVIIVCEIFFFPGVLCYYHSIRYFIRDLSLYPGKQWSTWVPQRLSILWA